MLRTPKGKLSRNKFRDSEDYTLKNLKKCQRGGLINNRGILKKYEKH